MAPPSDATTPPAPVAASPTPLAPGSDAHTLTRTDAMLLTMAFIWGINFSVMKYGLRYFEPSAYNSLRVMLATLALAALAFAPGARRPAAADARRLMLLGLLGHAVYQMLFIQGLSRARAGTVALVIGATPALIAILGRLWGYERHTRAAAVGIALSILGAALVVAGTTSVSATDDSIFGVALIAASSTCWAFYTIGLRGLTHRVDGVQMAAWTLFGGALPLIVVGIPSLLTTNYAAVPLAGWGSVLYSGLMAFVVAYVLWYRGVQRVGATRTSMFANLQPIVALGAAWVALAEVPTAWQFAGAACVVVGLYLSRR